MVDDAQGFRERMACLADESRFRIVLALAGTELCVSELARRVGLSQSCTTRHLQSLARRGLVRGSRRGRQVVFALCFDSPEIRLVLGAYDPAATNGTSAIPAPPQNSGPPRTGSPPDREVAGAVALALNHHEANDFATRSEPDPPVEPRPIHPRPGDLEDYLL